MNKAQREKRIAEIREILKTNELVLEMRKKGDSHIMSVFRFFGKWVDKSDPLRDAVKAVVFG